MTPTPLPARLLAKEEINILDGTCQPRARVVTRHDIAHDVTALLTRGLTTTSAGGFFFIPSLLQLGAHDLAATLGPPKHEGLPKERLALGLVFESIFGYTAGIRTVDTVSRADFGLLAGLPFLPSPSTQDRFLHAVPVKDALEFQTALGRRLVARGQVTLGHPVNIDGHNMKMYSRKAMKHSFITHNWLQVLGTTETPQIDQGVRHQFHPVVALLDVLETQQQPLEFVLPRKRPLDTLP